MRIKKFTGATVKEATLKMKQELGPDAVVIGLRKVRGGGLSSLVGKEMIELTGAYDNKSEDKSGKKGNYINKTLGDDKNDHSVGHIDKTPGDMHIASEKLIKEFRKQESAVDDNIYQHDRLRREVDELKSSLLEIVREIKHDKILPSLPDNLKILYQSLVDKEIGDNIAADIIQSVYENLGENRKNVKMAEQGIIDKIADRILTTIDTESENRRTKIIALVGPTGVGKTTTIAKLAAIFKLTKSKDVAMVSADTYRIGAIEQLRTFATIADIPMEVVYRPSEMNHAIRKFVNKDIVFIDTVGRSQRCRKELNELKRFMDVAEPDEVHLVLSAATSLKNMYDIMEKYKVLHPNRVIFSKLDEAVSYGSLLTLAHQYRIPISYITTGQNVPDDIYKADSVDFATMIYTGVVPNV